MKTVKEITLLLAVMISVTFGQVFCDAYGADETNNTAGFQTATDEKSEVKAFDLEWKRLDKRLSDAVKAVNKQDYGKALTLYDELEKVDDPWISWAATSGTVAIYRMMGDGDGARTVTARIANERKELKGLMLIWDGDTATIEGDQAKATETYNKALDENGNDFIDGVPVGVHALKQMSRSYSGTGNPAAAASAQRKLLKNYPSYVPAELTLVRALLYDAVTNGELPSEYVDDPSSFQAAAGNPLLIKRGKVYNSVSATDIDTVELAGIKGVRFTLSQEDKALLIEAQKAQKVTAAVTTATACTPATAWSGFQIPYSYNTSNYGYRFMKSDCCGGYHPGVDLNGGWGADDKDTDFRVVADGCVTDSPGANKTPSSWGAATVQHNFVRIWTSQYGHADKIYFSVGAAVTKGTKLGNIGDIGSPGQYHLHFEIREQDHPSTTDADAYYNSSKSVLGDYYQDPESFITAHPSSSYYLWFDEGAMSFYGNWTSKTGVGDEDDLRYASTTSSKQNYARKEFTVPSSGTYKFFAFVPWNYGTSTKAPYKIVKKSSGTTVLSKTVNQYNLFDVWTKLGEASLSSGTTYYLEVATNTGESGKLVSVDDFLILR